MHQKIRKVEEVTGDDSGDEIDEVGADEEDLVDEGGSWTTVKAASAEEHKGCWSFFQVHSPGMADGLRDTTLEKKPLNDVASTSYNCCLSRCCSKTTSKWLPVTPPSPKSRGRLKNLEKTGK